MPPFPDDIPTHPLLVIDYRLLQNGDVAQIDKLWKAATGLGFWYLKNHGADDEANAMFDVGKETIALPLEEKLKFSRGKVGFAFGYQGAGVEVVDNKGTLDVTESLNISVDDVLGYPNVVHNPYPSTVNARMSELRLFVQKSHEINLLLLDILNDRLGLPKRTLADLHKLKLHSRSVARVIYAPPQVGSNDQFHLLTPHTDFGSLSFLHNRLGGLQVLLPGSEQWFFVKPLPGHAICNIGDALNIFSGGLLRSNIHRVVPPPKAQAIFERWSVVYFTRPNDTVELCALRDKSALIAEAVANAPDKKYEPGVTAKDWVFKRLRSLRVEHYDVRWIFHANHEDIHPHSDVFLESREREVSERH
ncbi:Clavaminate synthase-like protein [Daedaleopsis nitida]|nr:Clavaminate synthase-like protein [Daedaleopsis nitida]